MSKIYFEKKPEQIFALLFPLLILFFTPFFIVPFSTMGDQPHYLISASALLEKQHFNLKPIYDNVAHGGSEAGYLFRGAKLDHHTVLIDASSNPHKEIVSWSKYFNDDGTIKNKLLTPASVDNYAEASIRPPGWPVFIAFFSLISRMNVELSALLLSHFAVILIALVIYLYLTKLGVDQSTSLVSSITLLIGSCYWVYANTAFADALMGANIAIVIYSLRFKKIWLLAISLSLGIWIKYQFIFYVIGFLLFSMTCFSFKEIAKTLAVLFFNTLAFVIFHYLIYGHFGPVTATAVESGNLLEQLNYAFLNISTSILLRNPWTYALIGLLFIPFIQKEDIKMLRNEIFFLLGIFFILVIPVMLYGLAYYPLGWGWPGRTVMPILIVLSIAFGFFLRWSHPVMKVIGLTLLVLSILVHLIATLSDINLVHHYDWDWLLIFIAKIFH
jgi:hypothetical protein